MFPDDRLRVAGLERGVAEGTEFADEHRNEGVAQNVVAEIELFSEFQAQAAEAAGHDRKFFQGISLQPGGEVWLDRDGALHSYLRDLGLDEDHAGVEAHVLGLELRDFALVKVRTDAGEEAEHGKGHQCAVMVGFAPFHDFGAARGGERDR